jgi:hypothetical protein
VLTAHDRLTALNLNAVVFAHAMPKCALAAATNQASAFASTASASASPGIGLRSARFVHRVESTTNKSILPPIEIP